MFPAGEGFTLKVLPEGTGVRLSHNNQMPTEPHKYQLDHIDAVCYTSGESLLPAFEKAYLRKESV
jgi:hypothetical protein